MKSLFNKTARITLATLLLPWVLNAQEKVIQISGSDLFIYPIVQKWITEYANEYPLSNTRFVLSKNAARASGLQIVAHQPQQGQTSDGERITYLGRYALIPVLNNNSPLLSTLKNGINKKDLKNLVFEKNLEEEDAFDDIDSGKKDKYNATIYSRDSKSSTAIALAGYFGQQPDQIKGKKIIGDDIYLLNAIQRDVNGLTFNSLNYIFDIESRKLKSGLSILPLKLKSQQQAAFNSKDIDQTISLLENTLIESIPVEEFGFIISPNYAKDKELVDFINWILEKGQKFNNQLGFLKLDAGSLAQQKDQLKDVFYTQK
jgi:ABC-type phosphate transport system substrate-binding protein